VHALARNDMIAQLARWQRPDDAVLGVAGGVTKPERRHVSCAPNESAGTGNHMIACGQNESALKLHTLKQLASPRHAGCMLLSLFESAGLCSIPFSVLSPCSVDHCG